MTTYPEFIETEAQLDEMLSEPSRAAVTALQNIGGDLMLLGVGGKMGMSLARMARRAADAAGHNRRIIGVSRFSNADVEAQLSAYNIETIRGDLLDGKFVRGLPDVPNVIYMAGMKFGTTDDPSLTWATNTLMPVRVCEKFAAARIVAFSTGNVYPLVPMDSNGSVEADPCQPVGEYAMSALGRERMFEYFSRKYDSIMSLVRLNYSVEMRYGVLVDIARRVRARQPIDVTMGYANVIWQADACALALASLSDAASPPFVVNAAGPEKLRIRQVAAQFGQLLGHTATTRGTEAPVALLSNGCKGHRLYGLPRVTADQLIRWVADWVKRGGRTPGKPTHFEITDGRF